MTRPRWPRPIGSCAPWSTGIQLYRLRRTHTMPEDDADLRRLGSIHGLSPGPVRDLRRTSGDAMGARSGASTRSCSTDHCSRRWRASTLARRGCQRAGSRGAARGPRLRGSAQRPAAPAGADVRGQSARGHPAHAAAGDAGLVRGRPGPGRRTARIPSGQRVPRRHPLVPAAPARRVRGGRAAGPRARHQPVRHRPPACQPRTRSPCSRTRRNWCRVPSQALQAEVTSVVDRQTDPEAAVAAIRSIRRRELFRIAVAEVLGLADSEQAGSALSDVAIAAVDGALRVARDSVKGAGHYVVSFAVIGMGRFGGHELGFGSDIDVMFVYDPRPGVDETVATTGGCRSRRGTAPTADGPERRPATGHRRGPATRGQAGSPGAIAGRPTRPTTSVGRPPGRRRRCCAPRSWRATPVWGSGSWGWSTASAGADR